MSPTITVPPTTAQLRELIEFMRNRQAHYEQGRNDPNEWLRGFNMGRGSAFGQAADFLEELLPEHEKVA